MILKERQKDPRFINTLGFFVAKGLLKTNRKDIVPRGKVKLNIKDVLWAANNVEPRIFEVFPAAFLHFPKTFKEPERIPKELMSIIERIGQNVPTGPNYKGIRYKDMYRWSNLTLSDKRTRPLIDKKISRTFRLRPIVITKLQNMAVKSGKDQTAVLEDLILDLE